MSVRRRIAAAVGAASLLVSACGADEPSGESLPALELTSLAGDRRLQLDELQGPAVINLWATWCAPCRRELPDFDAVAAQTAGEVAFVGVNVSDRRDDAAAFIDELGIAFDQYLDTDGELSAQLGTAVLPVTLVIDDEGRVQVRHLGPMDQEALIEAIGEATGSSS